MGEQSQRENPYLSVEANLAAETALNKPVGVDAVAVKLEAGVVEDKVHAAALLGSAELLRRDVLPNLAEVIT